MIAQVIPYAKTIRGKDWFDYAIPSSMVVTLRSGALVWVNFRNRDVLGVVMRTKDSAVASLKKVKPILEVCAEQKWYSEERLLFLRWFAAYYFISLPHAFKVTQLPYVTKCARKSN